MTSALLIALAASNGVDDICGSARSTRAFRRKLRAQGVEIDGMDVDHVWPRALGGADNELNYQLLESSVNRSLGAGALDKLARWPLATLQGFVVSAVASLGCQGG